MNGEVLGYLEVERLVWVLACTVLAMGALRGALGFASWSVVRRDRRTLSALDSIRKDTTCDEQAGKPDGNGGRGS